MDPDLVDDDCQNDAPTPTSETGSIAQPAAGRYFLIVLVNSKSLVMCLRGGKTFRPHLSRHRHVLQTHPAQIRRFAVEGDAKPRRHFEYRPGDKSIMKTQTT